MQFVCRQFCGVFYFTEEALLSASTQDLSRCHLLSHRCARCAAPRVLLSCFTVSLYPTKRDPAPGASSPATLCRAVDVTPLRAQGCSGTAYTRLAAGTPHLKLGGPNGSLTSHSLPGSRRLSEPRVQRWLGDGDRGPGTAHPPRTDAAPPVGPPRSHGCSQSSPLAREFDPSGGHAPGKAKQNSGTFGE